MSRNKRLLPASIRDILTNPTAATLEKFDPWNSASTGHQRAGKSHIGGPRWRQVLSQKLGRQFGDDTGRGGGVGDGEWDWVSSAQYGEARRREGGSGDIRSLMGGVKKRRLHGGTVDMKQIIAKDSIDGGITQGNGAFAFDDSRTGSDRNDRLHERNRVYGTPYVKTDPKGREGNIKSPTHATRCESKTIIPSSPPKPPQGSLHPVSQLTSLASTTKGIFTNLTIYVNGSTYPLISDHKLKHLLVSNGANVTFALARLTVTHVILGRPNRNKNGSGAGGGLAATKLQWEIQRKGGKGVKFVGVEWFVHATLSPGLGVVIDIQLYSVSPPLVSN
ncbi:hypothetical protein PAAG_08505 [Paracoccidioides lutzii Pb01]|uniref:BRCT domain-containing protein n=1 Tax=Paracoccidioides lutzii (strain ATCC MYA-826 / Pb01) TaxID=502779 RepID=C1HCL4_PARBA|nr:hypothetical protein PAAG_08505 [Paracoccidioides lutzii Pb01]EEH38778.2 hypothetical protein PAAG_08505 [Paracoccidioides lutzii Pb01]